MRNIFRTCILMLLAVSALTAAADETRYYFVRGGQLPQDVQTVDLRPEHSHTAWALRNIYTDATARYALFTKRSDSWWQVSVDASPTHPVDLSAVGADWTLCLRLRRTVDYPLTVCLMGQTTAQGYAITTTAVPADGQWYTVKIPLSRFAESVSTEQPQTGSLFRLHSDLGYIGNEVGIDFCYLTGDASVVDEGQVQAEQRYYLVSNARTPRAVNYDITDFSQRLSARYSGWMQWAYIPFPYYSMENGGAATMQLCTMSTLPMSKVDRDWALIGQLQTDMLGALELRLYLAGHAYIYTIEADELVRDGKTWNRLYLPLDEAEQGTYTDPSFVLFSLHAPALTPGVLTVGSLMLTNNHSASDPDPLVPGDPSAGKQIWLINDGTPLPVQDNITDYRLFYTNYWAPRFNNATRKESDGYMTIQASNGWYSVDAYPSQVVNLTAVEADWKLYMRIRTTSTYRPINLILYSDGNHELRRYQLTGDILPVAQNGQWIDIELPMSTFLGSLTSLLAYQPNWRVFTLHSDNGGAAGVEISVEELYFARQGESRPDPVPGDEPLTEPQVTPVTPEGIMNENENDNENMKVLRDGQLFIRQGSRWVDILGRPLNPLNFEPFEL